MSFIVWLDSGPLGMVSNPKAGLETTRCHRWLAARVSDGARVLVPEIADYKVRREKSEVVVATTNPRHLDWFVKAVHWPRDSLRERHLAAGPRRATTKTDSPCPLCYNALLHRKGDGS